MFETTVLMIYIYVNLTIKLAPNINIDQEIVFEINQRVWKFINPENQIESVCILIEPVYSWCIISNL